MYDIIVSAWAVLALILVPFLVIGLVKRRGPADPAGQDPDEAGARLDPSPSVVRAPVAPSGYVQPLMELIGEGAMVVDKNSRILYVNSRLQEMVGLVPGMTTHDMVHAYDVRSFDGTELTADDLPCSEALLGLTVTDRLIRCRRREGADAGEVIFAVGGTAVRDVLGEVVAAMMILRPVREDVAMAMDVRRRFRATSGEELRISV